MFPAVMFSLNLAGDCAELTFSPNAPSKDPEPGIGKDPVNSFFADPSLLKYSGVGVLTDPRNT